MCSIVGTDETGYWVNLPPGHLRISEVYATRREAEDRLGYYNRMYPSSPIRIRAARIV